MLLTTPFPAGVVGYDAIIPEWLDLFTNKTGFSFRVHNILMMNQVHIGNDIYQRSFCIVILTH